MMCVQLGAGHPKVCGQKANIYLILVSLCRAGERIGQLAERVENQEKADEIAALPNGKFLIG